MHFLVMAALAAPLTCLGLLFWLAHLEDTLVRDVRKSAHRHDPKPILSIAVPGATRPVPAPQPAPARQPAPAQPVPALQAVPEPETVPVMSLSGPTATTDPHAVPVAKPA